MRKTSWLPLCAFILAICAPFSLVLADEAPDSGSAANMPQREKDLIAILMAGILLGLRHSAGDAKQATTAAVFSFQTCLPTMANVR